jgi:hypothetical protein
MSGLACVSSVDACRWLQEYKLEEVTDKQDFSNRGIMYLCSFVTEGLEGRQPRQDTIQVRAAQEKTSWIDCLLYNFCLYLVISLCILRVSSPNRGRKLISLFTGQLLPCTLHHDLCSFL